MRTFINVKTKETYVFEDTDLDNVEAFVNSDDYMELFVYV